LPGAVEIDRRTGQSRPEVSISAKRSRQRQADARALHVEAELHRVASRSNL
jgi:hypothetical protein